MGEEVTDEYTERELRFIELARRLLRQDALDLSDHRIVVALRCDGDKRLAISNLERELLRDRE